MKTRLLLLFFLFFTVKLYAQLPDTLTSKSYNFIHYDLNILKNSSNANFQKQAIAFSNFLLTNQGQVRFLHIGDSHIQADFMTNEIRSNLFSLTKNKGGSRGLIFPFKAARSNNPRNYSIAYTGTWKSSRNVSRKKGTELGLTGMLISTNLAASLKYSSNPKYHVPQFNRIRIYTHYSGFKIELVDDLEKSRKVDSTLGFTDIYLKDYCKNFTLKIIPTKAITRKFELWGISLESDSAGFIYEAEGVNGASVASFLGCSLLENNLKAQNPNFVVLSLGTNDAYYSKYKDSIFLLQYTKLIKRIKETLPEAALIFATPSDHYLFRKRPNEKVEGLCKQIYAIAEAEGCAIWDLYEIMGGRGSIKTWQANKLAAVDKIHFTQPGYFLQGKLFFDALINALHLPQASILETTKP